MGFLRFRRWHGRETVLQLGFSLRKHLALPRRAGMIGNWSHSSGPVHSCPLTLRSFGRSDSAKSGR